MTDRTWISHSNAELTSADLAVLSLQIAEGLPCSIPARADTCLKTLQEWTEFVHAKTDEDFRRGRHRNAHDTQADKCMLSLVTAVQLHLHVGYNQAFMDGEFDGRDSCHLFLHGPLSGRTCATMPVLYTAIGRRLGYPLRLAQATTHTFCRWDDPSGECFNIEATSWGFHKRSDEDYRSWPIAVTPQDVAAGFLRSMMPREEVAYLLAARLSG